MAGSGGDTAVDAAQIAVGARVVIGKDRDKATVRYVGPVEGQKGLWVGVEWDDASRGKHDGSTGGKRYFTVASGPAAGSFVRAEKVHAGAPLLAALLARYNNEAAEGAAAGADRAVYLSTKASRRVLVELVGEEQVTERQRQTQLLTRARVVDACVSSVDAPEALLAALPALEELDLTGNLLWRWAEPAALLSALPRLHTLNLSANCLALPAARGPPPPRLGGLRALVLNGCGVGWADVAALAASLPCLAELHVAGNAIASLDDAGGSGGGGGSPPPQQQQQQQQQQEEEEEEGGGGGGGGGGGEALPPPINGLQSLEASCGGRGRRPPRRERRGRRPSVLGLEDNAISSWWEVLRLAWLPRLRRLHLSGNPISELRYPAAAPPAAAPAAGAQPSAGAAAAPAAAGGGPGAAGPAAFAALEALLLGGCRVGSWRDVDELDGLPRLRELRLSGNPLVDDAKGGGRFEIVARVGGLVLLNGADVKPRERRDCELRYLHAVAAEEAEAGADAAARAVVAARHPRVSALKTRYDERDYTLPSGSWGGTTGAFGAAGAAAAAASAPPPPPAGAAGTLAAALCEVVLRHGAKSSRKKLPRGTSVGALKLLCERLFRVKAARQVLLVGGGGGGADSSGGGGGGGGGDEMDIGGDDTKPLSFWELEPGAVVRVVEADGGSAGYSALAAAGAAADHEERMQRQLQAGERLRVAAIQLIGRGAFSYVVLARNVATNEVVAIKVLRREEASRYLEGEIVNHSQLRHPHVIQFREVFLTPTDICIAMEYASGGTLFDYIQRSGRLHEPVARWFFQQIMLGLDYCHRKGVANRDIKLENTLLQSVPQLPLPLVKICDFGYSKTDYSSAAKSRVGTPTYMAPEVLINHNREATYDGKMVDVWSCGVMLFVMVCGCYPFGALSDDSGAAAPPTDALRVLERMMARDFGPPPGVALSAHCRDLLASMLAPHPAARARVADVLAHPWFVENLPPRAMEMNDGHLEAPPPPGGQDPEAVREVAREARRSARAARARGAAAAAARAAAVRGAAADEARRAAARAAARRAAAAAGGEASSGGGGSGSSGGGRVERSAIAAALAELTAGALPACPLEEPSPPGPSAD
ncbi:MAG: hypothetical protein J3K34DRAFT_523747 [Monoraphidium minutum]|nr:MAG: hypothetical protein J3K34DRAFT_523747 [Monoraphidium minutum]